MLNVCSRKNRYSYIHKKPQNLFVFKWFHMKSPSDDGLNDTWMKSTIRPLIYLSKIIRTLLAMKVFLQFSYELILGESIVINKNYNEK